jgi:ribosomal protein L11 methyltransferase
VADPDPVEKAAKAAAAEPKWLEVSLLVDGELAEAVSEVLSRFTSNGVVVESGVNFNEEEDEGTPFGPVKVYGYLPFDERLEENRQRLNEALWHLGRIQTLPEPAFRPIQDEDWMAAWKQHYHPIPIGKRLLILPAWIEQEDPRRVAVKIDPSMAFGTGTHPTTQLCLELIEAVLRPGTDVNDDDVIDVDVIDIDVIDVGCGSGILSIAALKLGARHSLGVDIDSQAARSTRENAAANGVLENLETGVGSVGEVREGQFSITQAPLVLANILAPVIIRLFEAGLADLLAPGPDSVLILSGILDEQAARVVDAAQRHGLVLADRRQQLDWVALLMKKG